MMERAKSKAKTGVKRDVGESPENNDPMEHKQKIGRIRKKARPEQISWQK